ARGQTPDQLQPVRQPARRQHLIGADAVEGGHAGRQSGRLGRVALQTVAARHQRRIGGGQAHPALLRSAALAWASSPSSRASAAATGARTAAPCSLTVCTDMVVMKLAVVTPPSVRAAPSVGRTWLGPAA